LGAIFEMAGTWAVGDKEHKGIWVRAGEVGKDRIFIEPTYSTAIMTAEEARNLAKQLNRLARRVEHRNA
jgi:hypothetical protein